MNKKDLELYSSCYTLSDMEIFIFPQLFYSLVIANILSPILWQWKDDPWFAKMKKRSLTYKINRIKQFIMQNFSFNLDLETWGLTDKFTEIKRFEDIIDIELIKSSNALFGYEGDKYYFDLDIRKHFGLDKYNTNIIPYWKTETVEAMTAFQNKKGYLNGAGECVSLATLYVAMLFVVGKIPLENIFLIATPLHSQNFINIGSGVLTNNRRILKKSMWFNGTTLSTKARRALENENITIVSHISGYIHWLYKKATIDEHFYNVFKKDLFSYLSEKPSKFVFRSFLRFDSIFQKEFYFHYKSCCHNYYIQVEKIFHYEHSSSASFSDNSFKKLLDEIDPEEFSLSPFSNRILLNDFEEKTNFLYSCDLEKRIMKSYKKFLQTNPKLPLLKDKIIKKQAPLKIEVSQNRKQILNMIKEDNSSLAKITLHTFRKMDMVDWEPFLYAAKFRNPIFRKALKGKNKESCFEILKRMNNNSIYDGFRLAQPDEVWNFGCGDGIEKAILFGSFFFKKGCKIKIEGTNVTCEIDRKVFSFITTKEVGNRIFVIN